MIIQIITFLLLRVLKTIEKTIHSDPVWRLSDCECEIHVYLFQDDFLDKILYLHLLLIFV